MIQQNICTNSSLQKLKFCFYMGVRFTLMIQKRTVYVAISKVNDVQSTVENTGVRLY